MQKLILSLIMVVSILGATDCIEYKEGYEKYKEKASDNKKMASRYTVIAEKYNYMYLNCMEDKNDSQSMTSTSSVFKAKKTPIVKKISKRSFKAAKQYRVNPYNSIK